MNSHRTPSQIAAIALAIVVVLAALTTSGYFMFVKAPEQMVARAYQLSKKIADDIDAVFHFRPKVTLGGTMFVEDSKSIAELSTIEKRFESVYDWKSSWMGSEKIIHLQGVFVAKAGYDLMQPFAMDVANDSKTIKLTLPPAKLNSVEAVDIHKFSVDDGWWNRVSEEEKQNALNAFLVKAKADILATGIVVDADASLVQRITEIIQKNAPALVTIQREPLR